MSGSVIPSPKSGPVVPLLVAIGLLVGGNFALGKYLVLQGASPLLVFELQVLGAALLLGIALIFKAPVFLSPLSKRQVIAYCIINGMIGISAPQILGFFALQEVPTGLFTMVVTLSPLLTFLISSLTTGRILPLARLGGILLGLVGVSIATARGALDGDFGIMWLAAACAVPCFLAASNVYRDRAMPQGVDPLSLAAGTLISQAVLFLPITFVSGSGVSLAWTSAVVLSLIALGSVTALSYMLTFELFRRADSVTVSQVGYFATLAGFGAGALFFDEPITVGFLIAAALLFLGMAMTNGHFSSALSRVGRNQP